MAEDFAQTRTEEPTPRRREEARKKGQVAISPELSAAVIVFVGIIFLLIMGPAAGSSLLNAFRTDLVRVAHADLDVPATQAIGLRLFRQFLAAIGVLLGVLVAAAFGIGVAQAGFRFLPDRLAFDFSRLNPATGFERIWSLQAARRLLIALLKATVFVIIAILVLRGRLGAIQSLGRGSVEAALGGGWAICIRLLVSLAAAMLLFGIIDYFIQWRRHETSLRMTRQELKEEIKREEGDPLIRARIRQLQQEQARHRIRLQVPKATVVITNPTHYAVALRYERGSALAPVVIAKGAGVFARQIVELARRHAVPVLERPIVARAIYATVKEGKEIPQELFRAVAEVIAFVYRLRGAA